MVYMSLFELIAESEKRFGAYSDILPEKYVALFFLLGLIIAFVIDLFTHNFVEKREEEGFDTHSKALLKSGLFTAFALGIHNIPEGVITFATAIIDPVFGVSVAIAVAIHNIPEGICIALPIYYATKSKMKSFLLVGVAALAEPFGALLAFLILRKSISDFSLGAMLASVAGIMVYVAFDELLPSSKKMGHGHIGLAGLVTGMCVMWGVLQVLSQV
jgi:ZIP family zinc transporter